MENRYSLSKESAKELAGLLSSNEPGEYYQDFHNLLGATIYQVSKTMNALQLVMPVAAGVDEGPTDLPEVANLAKLAREVELSC